MMSSPSALIAPIGLRRIGLVVAAVAVGLAALGFVRDPFGWRAAKVNQLQQAVAGAKSQARARALEAEGERGSVERVSAALTATAQAQSATADLSRAAASADDADQPLDPARVARLRADDDALCRIARLIGCPRVTNP